MRRYAFTGQQDAIIGQTIGSIASATTVKPHLFEVICGSAATPADQGSNFGVKRWSVTPTAGSTPVAIPMDPGDPASLCTCIENATAGTYTTDADCLNFSLNQQATFRWVAPPDEGIVLPAAATGVGLVWILTTGSALHEAWFQYCE